MRPLISGEIQNYQSYIRRSNDTVLIRIDTWPNYRPMNLLSVIFGNGYKNSWHGLGIFLLKNQNELIKSESFAADKYGILGHVGDGNFHIGMLTFQIPNSVLFKKTLLEC